jgi:radical SAM superfamily enzyme YgiQ (UPF0313 family)
MHHRSDFSGKLLYKLNSNPILVLQQLAAATPEEHWVKLIDDRYDSPFYHSEIDLVGISTLTPSAPRAYMIADYYQNQGIPVVLGGVHPSAIPEEAKNHADSVVIGEAEESWPRLLEDLQNNSLQPYYTSTSYVPAEDISEPKREKLRIKPLFSPIATSRGCPYHCSFCTLTHLHGKQYRSRPIENIIQEIKNTHRRFLVFLHDASLTINKDYAKSLFKAMIPLKRKFIAYGSAPILLQNPSLLKLSKEAGCIIWCIGFESVLQDSLKDDAQKNYTVTDYELLVKKIHQHGINVFGSFVLGFDHDTSDIFDRTLVAAYDYNIDAAEFNVLTPFPITRLFHQLDREGRILTKDWSKYDLQHVVFQPKNFSSKELQNGVSHISRNFYSFDKTIQRIITVGITSKKFSNLLVVGAMNTIMARFHSELSFL